ncbi:MAG: hypothetical protein Ct9H300mP15_26740 [Gemmatimonadota bacterium]|nr:MAG: hypothetical protein Ct9H300mP15_26740 [Gemmatimonadota bacterium]
MAFKIAGSMAIKNGIKKATPVLLEPVMDVEVVRQLTIWVISSETCQRERKSWWYDDGPVHELLERQCLWGDVRLLNYASITKPGPGSIHYAVCAL